jgi:uncharacterized protein YjbI with pentapeptide repeats
MASRSKKAVGARRAPTPGSRPQTRVIKTVPPLPIVHIVHPPETTPWWDHLVWGSALRISELSAIVAGVVATVFAIYSLNIAIEQTDLAKKALQQQQEATAEQNLTTAWQILTSSSPSAGGRRHALTVQLEAIGEVSGLDVSCNVVGRTDANGKCLLPPNFDSIKIKAPETRRILNESSFAENSFYSAEFENVSILGTDMSRTGFSLAKIKGGVQEAVIWHDSDFQDATFDGVEFGVVDFSDSIMISTTIRNAKFRPESTIDISGADLCLASDLIQRCIKADKAFFEHVWFYADDPPTLNGPIVDLDDTLVRTGCTRPASQNPHNLLFGAARRIAMDLSRMPSACSANPMVPLKTVAKIVNRAPLATH